MTRARSNANSPTEKGSIIVGTSSTDSTSLAVGANNQVLTADSTQTAGVKWATFTGSALKLQTFTSSSTWTCPTGVSRIQVLCVGGGGGGQPGGCSGSSATTNGGSGGSGGAIVYAANVPVTAGNTYTVTVGGGGNGGTAVTVSVSGSSQVAPVNNGANGTASSFGTSGTESYVLAYEGKGANSFGNATIPYYQPFFTLGDSETVIAPKPVSGYGFSWYNVSSWTTYSSDIPYILLRPDFAAYCGGVGSQGSSNNSGSQGGGPGFNSISSGGAAYIPVLRRLGPFMTSTIGSSGSSSGSATGGTSTVGWGGGGGSGAGAWTSDYNGGNGASGGGGGGAAEATGRGVSGGAGGANSGGGGGGGASLRVDGVGIAGSGGNGGSGVVILAWIA